MAELTKETTGPTSPAAGETLLQVRDLVKHFPVTQGVLFKRTVGQVKALSRLNASIPDETYSEICK